MTASLSTHVLDGAGGGGLAGVAVEVHDPAGALVARATTGADGRVAALADGLDAGPHRLTWRVGSGVIRMVSAEVVLTAGRHHHVPLLASGGSMTVYLGA